MKNILIETEDGFFIRKGKLVISSLQVSDIFERKHGNVLAQIRRIIEGNPKLKRNFYDENKTIKEKNGRNSLFLMNRKGFDTLTQKYNSIKELEAKSEFIKLFTQREAEHKAEVAQAELNKLIVTPPAQKEHNDMLSHEELFEVSEEQYAYQMPVMELTIKQEVVETLKEASEIHAVTPIPKVNAIVVSNIEAPIVTSYENEFTIDSRDVAEMVGRTHGNVVRDINTIIEHLGGQLKNDSSYFIESEYTNSQNKKQPCYLLTKKGCELFSTRMTGAKGTMFAVAYIEKFNEMEQQIQAPMVVNSFMIADPIERAKLWIQEEQERLLLAETVETQVKMIEHKDEVIQQQSSVIEEQAEKIEETVGIIRQYQQEMVQTINHKHEEAYVQSQGLTIDEMVRAIKHMVSKDSFDGQKSWNKLYSNYNAKYDVNIHAMRKRYEEETGIKTIYVIDYVSTDFVLTSNVYETAKEVFGFQGIGLSL